MTVRGFVGPSRRWVRLWRAAGSIRWVISHFPTRKGRGRLAWILERVLADSRGRPHEMFLGVPSGGRVLVGDRTGIFRAAIGQGQFEAAELALLTSLCRPGSVAFDVGANVGLFTVAFAQAVGPTGRVLAVEPYAPSINDLRENLRRNGLDNVVIVPMAVGASKGSGRIIMSDDPALIRVEQATNAGLDRVGMTTLDHLWNELGRPLVSVVKIDVEGTEADVLRGGASLLASGPTLMVETHTSEYEETVALLSTHGYERQMTRLEPWNHVFKPTLERHAPTRADDPPRPR
jgi:FkbM family methyltransferase